LSACLVPYVIALSSMFFFFFFFFQAEDGIRDRNVTGVQTCALPIYPFAWLRRVSHRHAVPSPAESVALVERAARSGPRERRFLRSEERRVGKECRSRMWPDH